MSSNIDDDEILSWDDPFFKGKEIRNLSDDYFWWYDSDNTITIDRHHLLLPNLEYDDVYDPDDPTKIGHVLNQFKGIIYYFREEPEWKED